MSEFKYHPGKSSGDADGLSRMPLDMEQFMQTCSQEVQPEVITSITHTFSLQDQEQDLWMCLLSMATYTEENQERITSPVKELSKYQLCEAQQEDLLLGKVKRIFDEGQMAEPERKRDA